MAELSEPPTDVNGLPLNTFPDKSQHLEQQKLMMDQN